MTRFVHLLKNEMPNFLGWSTNSKIVVFESDDWGTIRMPSTKSFDALLKNGIDLTSGDSARYNQFDTIESANDLDALFTVLRSVKDQKGNYPVFTAFCLTSNPDFDRIERSQFRDYYFESVTETLKNYYPAENVWQHWIDGVNDRLIRPQFHGREHVNVPVWMESLRAHNSQTKRAFEERMWGFNNLHPHNISFLASFDLVNGNELSQHQSTIESGLDEFEKLYGYRANVFVPPNGLLHEKLYKVTRSAGINYAYSARLHFSPLGYGKRRRRVNFLGWKNSAGQHSVIRNAFFEPSQGQGNCVSKCLSEIDTAFRWRKPAIISSHRVNYIGTLHPENRARGLEKLDELLTAILKRWPDVEFLSSDQLGDRMSGHEN